MLLMNVESPSKTTDTFYVRATVACAMPDTVFPVTRFCYKKPGFVSLYQALYILSASICILKLLTN